jgi:pyridoxamine 5'-phosphate oxidase family protein
VAFSYNPDLETIDIGGHNFGARKKYRDVQRNPWAAIVVDDLVSTDPWTPRMLEIRGRAEAVAEGGAALRPGFDDEIIRIHPERVVSFGLRAGQQSSDARSV